MKENEFSGASPEMDCISHVGPWLTDEAGRVVQVHGVSLYEKIPPYIEDGMFDEDFAFLVSEGLNAIRVNWVWEAAEPEPGVYDDEYLDRIVTLNDRMARFGIRSLIGMAENGFSTKYGGFGAPPWACINRYFGRKTLVEHFSENAIGSGKSSGFLARNLEAEQEAWDNFYADAQASDDIGVLTHCINTWNRLAARLESKPNIYAIDLFHEPAPGFEFEALHDEVRYFKEPTLFEIKKLWRFHRKFIKEARKADKKHILFYQGSCYHTAKLYAESAVNMPAHLSDDPNIGYSIHLTAHDALSLAPAKFKSLIGKALDNQCGHAKASDAACIVSGFRMPLVDSIYANFIDTLTERNLPWTYFTFRGMKGPDPEGAKLSLLKDNAKPASMENVVDGRWDALVVPYAQLTAGAPVSWKFDRETKVMEYTYSTAPVGGNPIPKCAATEIFIPARHYPKGYSVEARGAIIKSHPTSPWIVLENDDSAKEVCVVVRPKNDSFTERANKANGPTAYVKGNR
jgi:endoglycosylceramidase